MAFAPTLRRSPVHVLAADDGGQRLEDLWLDRVGQAADRAIGEHQAEAANRGVPAPRPILDADARFASGRPSSPSQVVRGSLFPSASHAFPADPPSPSRPLSNLPALATSTPSVSFPA